VQTRLVVRVESLDELLGYVSSLAHPSLLSSHSPP
jgi:hypothetical protein